MTKRDNSWPVPKNTEKLKSVPFNLHIISDTLLILPDTVDCEQGFENELVLTSCMFLEDKGE